MVYQKENEKDNYYILKKTINTVIVTAIIHRDHTFLLTLSLHL